ncbi:MAG: DUF547 domain-containing protein [Bacteroidia bacterium]
MNPVTLSEQILLAVKTEEDTQALVDTIAGLPADFHTTHLQEEAAKKAFWINIYNAYFLILRKIQKLDKKEIYTKKAFTIGNTRFSLDDVEHGILRKYRYKFSLGYLPNHFAKKHIKRLAVNKVDYRIHFALNCGAISCPPIAFYQADRIEEQLEMAAMAFLEGETTFFDEKKEVHISRLMLWYRGDFGGKKGIRKMLHRYLNKPVKGYKLIFKSYDWTEKLDNFIAFE